MNTKDKRLIIDNLDLSIVKQKLCMEFNNGGFEWPSLEADEAISSYRVFLHEVLSIDTSEILKGLQPDAIQDIVWHTHILFTEKYHQDCQSIFGEYLHHVPKLT